MTSQDPKKIAQDIGRRVAQIRRERNLTQRQLAAKLKVSIPWLSKVETVGSNMTVTTIIKLAAALGVQGRDLWDPPNIKEQAKPARGRPKTE